MTAARFHASHAVIDGAIARDVAIVVAGGAIVSTEASAVPVPGATSLHGLVAPGMVNAHSHVFHRMLRGRSWSGGDFWSWRDAMYEVVNALTPDLLESVAVATFAEMLAAGITAVGEFHYVHHGPDGVRYTDANEMSMALVRAADATGIRLCVLDTCYLVAGVDGRPLVGPQLRFGDGSGEGWAERHSELVSKAAGRDRVTVGAAIHSVRAVPPEAFSTVAEAGGPLHVHVSEQPAENDACLEHHGVTPTAFLDRHGVLSDRTTAVHAVHVTEDDRNRLAASGTGVCVCPTTELDLGDGTVDVAGLRRASIGVGIGSDSHAVIDLLSEARLVEWNDRARSGRRGVHTAADLWHMVGPAGAASLGYDRWGISAGAPADFVVLSTDSIRTAGSELEGILGSATAHDILATYVGGVLVTELDEHVTLGPVAELASAAFGEGAAP